MIGITPVNVQLLDQWLNWPNSAHLNLVQWIIITVIASSLPHEGVNK